MWQLSSNVSRETILKKGGSTPPLFDRGDIMKIAVATLAKKILGVRRDITRIKKRIKYMWKKGVQSVAADVLLSNFEGGIKGFNLSRNPPYAEVREFERLIQKFFTSKTSTTAGAREAMTNKKKGFYELFRSMGYEGDIDMVWDKLKNYDMDSLLRQFDFDSDKVMVAIAMAAEGGSESLDAFLNTFGQYYG